MFRTDSRRRPVAALALMLALCLGSLGHVWHHLHDTSCGPDGRHGSQPCGTCSSLHGASAVRQAASPEPPVFAVVAPLATTESGRASARARTTGAPRAPPRSPDTLQTS